VEFDPDKFRKEFFLVKVVLFKAWEKVLASRADGAKSTQSRSNPVLAFSDKVKAAFHGLSDEQAKETARQRPIVPADMHDMVVQFLTDADGVHGAFKNTCLMAILSLTICVGTASCERGFSSMHTIMVPLRNRISPVKLDALMRIAQYELSDDDIDRAIAMGIPKSECCGNHHSGLFQRDFPVKNALRERALKLRAC
jgi:hypothetical protein